MPLIHVPERGFRSSSSLPLPHVGLGTLVPPHSQLEVPPLFPLPWDRYGDICSEGTSQGLSLT